MGDPVLAPAADDAERCLGVDARGGQGVGPLRKVATARIQSFVAFGAGFFIRILGPVRPVAEGVVHRIGGRSVLADIGAQRLHDRDVVALAVFGDAFQRIDRAEADFEVGDGFFLDRPPAVIDFSSAFGELEFPLSGYNPPASSRSASACIRMSFLPGFWLAFE